MGRGHATPENHASERAAVDPRIPLFLVTGPANDAKAEVLRHITLQAGDGVALALMDKRSLNIVAPGIAPASADPAMGRTASGSVCIDAGSDPVHALYQLHLRRLGLLEPELSYDAIVFEVGDDVDTGAFVAVVQNDMRLDMTNRIAGIIHAVHIGDCPYRNSDDQLRKIGEADIIVLAGARGSTSHMVASARAAIASLNPFASVLETAALDLERLHMHALAPGEFSGAEAQRLCRESGTVRLFATDPDITAIASNLHNDAHRNDTLDSPLRALRMLMPGEASLMGMMQGIRQICVAHGSDVLRLSAVLNVRNADHPVALDIVGGTLFHPSYYSRVRRTDSDISIIGRALDIPRTMDALIHCRWDSSPTKEEFRAAV